MSALIINANALNIPLADKSVQCVVTSPPYYGLRDYGTDGQLGLEPTPDAYIANLVEVFREVWRVLRDDGTVWLNLGDSYASMKSRYNQKAQNLNGGKAQDNEFQGNKTDLYHHKELGLKDKDLIGIPWMVAFALRADGWYLRQDIIWHKPNPMPESVKDRCTKSHEYIFLLSKSAKYYYDNEAVKEPISENSHYGGTYRNICQADIVREQMGNYSKTGITLGATINMPVDGKRNKRDVWTVPTKPYKGAHYATFPPDLIKPMILAGCPQFVCVKCGAPYERVVERVVGYSKECPKTQEAHEARGGIGKPVGTVGKSGGGRVDGYSTTLGFQPTCNCNAGTTSGIVFDPFVGSGTTVATAVKLGRRGVGLDLSMKYLRENARERIYQEEMQPVLCTREEVM